METREQKTHRLRKELEWVQLDLQLTQTPRSPEDEPSPWTVTAALPYPLDDERADREPETIFWMDGWLFPVSLGAEMASILDATSGDAEVFVSLTDASGALDAMYETGSGSNLIAVNHVTLAPEWRGMGGLGRYLTGSALLLMSDLAACIALHPSPFELRDKHNGKVPRPEWQAGVEKLTELWRTIGAEPAPGDNLVIDPVLIHLEQAVDRLYQSLSAGRRGPCGPAS